MEYSHALNKYFDKIFVLNLKKDTIKRRIIENRLNKRGIKYEIFYGADGHSEPCLSKYREFMQHRKVRLRSPGVFGYMESWRLLMERVLNEDYKNFLLLEDDVFFSNDFDDKIKQLDQLLSTDWKVILLGASQYSRIPEVKDGFYNCTHWTNGSFATALNSSIFKELYNNITNFTTSFDSGPLRNIYKKYPKNCYTFYPNIMIPDVTTSSILSGRNMAVHARSMYWNIKNYDLDCFKLKLRIIVYVTDNAPYLDHCLKSLVDQTYINNEIVIIDCSESPEIKHIIDKYVKINNEITVVKKDISKPKEELINEIKKIRGSNIVATVDGNEISMTNRFEKMITYMIINNKNRVGSKSITIENMGTIINEKINDSFILNECEKRKNDIINNEHAVYFYPNRTIISTLNFINTYSLKLK